ncbi:MAG: NADP-specific glutamate dehydrogenase [Bacteroidales bacterium]|nr:NADP-specific glutamate dehydrogenase [Bacteroidales bacterium]MCF8457990.1 NADP-specific glutamate dehydrogenase [Bacteroidales bacterium]
MDIDQLMFKLEKNNPGQPEYIQAVREFLESIEDFINDNPQYEDSGIIDRIIEPDRSHIFKIAWSDDEGKVQVNKGFRVQFNNALGPYKGGLRFHPNVNLGVFKFLGFEQVFKNALTSLPMGGAKGGSDFDPKGKSNDEVMRFCQAYMLELWKLIGTELDVPAGEMGVGTREIGYLFGMYKKISGQHSGVLTGKGIDWGGSQMRNHATGYGLIYFTAEMLKANNMELKDKRIALSGFGNVAWGAAQKATEMGAKVVSISGPDGHVYFENGMDMEMIDYMLELRSTNEDIVRPMSYEFPNVQFRQNKKSWEVRCDIAIPCAIQDELNEHDAAILVANGCKCVVEGANMPCTPEAIDYLKENAILFAPGKAANAGGVATSGLEMSQNALRYQWSNEEVDKQLFTIMKRIHDLCREHGTDEDGKIDYVKGANIASFKKVANAMLDQGMI